MKEMFQIIRTTRPLWKYYLVVSSTSIIIAILNLLIPLLTGRAIDEITNAGDGDVTTAAWLAVGVFAVDASITVISNFGGHVGDMMAIRLQKMLSENYFSHLLKLPQSYFDDQLSGKIIARLNRSIDQITSFMLMMSNNFLQFIFSTIFSLVVIAFLSWPVALLLGSLYPIYIYLTARSSSTWQDYQKEKLESWDIASGRFAEAVNEMKVVKSFNQQEREINFFTKHMKRMVKVNKPQSIYWHKQDMIRRITLNLIFLGVYAYIFITAVQGNFTPGEAVTLILYASQIRIPIFTISFLVDNTQRAIADSRDYFEVLQVAPHEDDCVKPLRVSEGAIRFNEVGFSYTKGEEVLSDITLDIKSGSTVALVGESGGGKTTITNLLMRMYEITSGTVSIDGQDISDVSLESLRKNIGVVFQDPALFSGTIQENIVYAKPNASIKEIEKAAKAANAHEFVSKLNDGYKTEIGERGLKLSGGQKQRIAIARALLKDAPILILDEATSSLDNKSEQLVQDALDHLMKDRTTLIIAHRLSTIQKVDQIITLENGRVDEIGTPAQLAKTDGVYAKLLKVQNAKTEQDKKVLRSYDIAT
jgi:ATP-binding cassette subfamily B protein